MYVFYEHKYIIVGSTASVVVSSPRLSSRALMKSIRRKYHKQKTAILGTNLMFFTDSVFRKKGSRTKNFLWLSFFYNFLLDPPEILVRRNPKRCRFVPLFQKSPGLKVIIRKNAEQDPGNSAGLPVRIIEVIFSHVW